MDTEQIAQITIKGESEGMDKVKSDLEGVTKAQDDLAKQSGVTATVTETTAKKHLDSSSAYDKLHNSLDGAAGATEAFAKRATIINNALSQGHITQAQAAADLVLLAERYPKAAQAQETLGNGLTKLTSLFTGNTAAGTKTAEIATLLEGRQLRLASSVGLVGEALAVVGPVGIAAAAGLGGILVVMDSMSSSAERMGGVAREIASFAAVTGLSTDAVQALRSEGVKFGLSMDETSSGIERFTYNLEAAHGASGTLYDAVQKVNPALAVQLANSRGTADGLQILARAWKQAGDESQKAMLVRAAAGRNAGPEFGQMLGGIADAGGVAAVTSEVNKLDLITKEQTAHWKELSGQIEEGSTTWRNNIASIFTSPILEMWKSAEDRLVAISRLMKSAAGAGPASSAAPGSLLPSTSIFGRIATGLGVGSAVSHGATGSFDNGASGSWGDPQKTEAASGAAAELTTKTNALTAAQNDYNKALEAYDVLQSSGAATEKQLSAARQAEGSTLQTLANVEKQRIADLSGAATASEVYQQKVDDLTARLLLGKITAEDYNRALHGDTANQVQALQDQLRVVTARTAQEKLSAQYVADYNAAIRATKSPEDAAEIASAKRAISNAQAAKSALDEQQAMLGVGAAAQSAADAAQSTADAYQRAATAALAAAAGIQTINHNGDFGGGSVNGASGGFGVGGDVAAGKQGSFAGGSTQLGMPQSMADKIDRALATGGIDAAIKAATNTSTIDNSGAFNIAFKSGITPPSESDIENTVSQLIALKNSQTTDKTAQLTNDQQFLAWLQTRPETIARDQQIASMISAMQSLTGATNSNTSALDALSPYYATDPRTSHIGFRSQGMATGGEFTVPGGYSANDNMTGIIPLASGEIVSVRRPGQNVSGGSSQTISIVNHITIAGNASKDEVGRTMYQVGQTLARQLQASGR